MREMFMEIDKDKSGNITLAEFSAALHKKGQVVTEKEVERIMQVRARRWRSWSIGARGQAHAQAHVGVCARVILCMSVARCSLGSGHV